MTQFKTYTMAQTFTVEDLMTSHESLEVARLDHLEKATATGRQQGYDIMPVQHNGRIVSILNVKTGEVEPVTDQWLVSRDTPIPELIHLFLDTGRAAFLVLHGQDIIGLVSPADLNKLPVRVYVYHIIGDAEMSLARAVGKRYGDDRKKIHRALGDKRWQTILEENQDLKEGNVDIDLIQLLYLNDLVKLVKKDQDLRTLLAEYSNSQLDELTRLRNKTMHLVRPLVKQVSKDLPKLQKRISIAIGLIERLNMDGFEAQ